MNKNRTHRTTKNLDLQSLIRRADIEFDERVRFVEFVCDVWNEGRFGIGRPDPVVINWNNGAELEPARFSDLLDDEPSGSRELTSCNEVQVLGRAVYQKIEAAFQRAKQMGFLETNAIGCNISADSTSNQGRGSPKTLKHQRCVVIQPAAPPQENTKNDPSRNAAA
jgi:hypothetical protein